MALRIAGLDVRGLRGDGELRGAFGADEARLPQGHGAADGHRDQGGQASRNLPPEIAHPARGRQNLREAEEGEKGPVGLPPGQSRGLAGGARLARGAAALPGRVPGREPVRGDGARLEAHAAQGRDARAKPTRSRTR